MTTPIIHLCLAFPNASPNLNPTQNAHSLIIQLAVSIENVHDGVW